jgi:hypothetical protein
VVDMGEKVLKHRASGQAVRADGDQATIPYPDLHVGSADASRRRSPAPTSRPAAADPGDRLARGPGRRVRAGASTCSSCCGALSVRAAGACSHGAHGRDRLTPTEKSSCRSVLVAALAIVFFPHNPEVDITRPDRSLLWPCFRS